MPGEGRVEYQQAYNSGIEPELVPETAFQIPASSTAVVAARTLFQDACLQAMTALISSGRDKDLGNDDALAFRCTQIGRAMCNQIERYTV